MSKVKEIIRGLNVFFLIFFAFCGLYFLFIFKSSLYYHLHQPIFLFDRDFFNEFLSYPGGISEWIGQFITQFFYWDLAGAVIIGFIFSAIYSIIYKIIKKPADIKSAVVLAFLPVGLLLVLQNIYTVPFLLTLKYLIAILFFLFYLSIPSRFKIFFFPLFVLIYGILGGSFYLFLVLLIVLYESLFSKSYLWAGVAAVTFIVLPFVAARFFYMITFTEAYLYIIPYEFYFQPYMFKPGLIYFLFMFSLPLLMIILFLYLKILKGKIHFKIMALAGPYRSEPAQGVLVLLAAGLILGFSLQQLQKKNIQIDCYAEQEQWQRVVDLSFHLTGFDRLTIFNVNRALFHTGQLLDSLFNYNQFLGTDDLFINKIIAGQIAIPASDLYFDLGHINASQALAYEGQTKLKYNTRILKRLVLTNIINGNNVAAGKFLTLLSRSLLHRSWSAYYQKLLTNESLIRNDPFIQSKRELRPRVDFFIDQAQPDRDLIRLLNANEKNKMAFEYLMAYYLLDCDLANLFNYLQKFKTSVSSKLPRHLGEALLLFRTMAPKEMNFNFNDYLVNRRFIEKFTRFTKILYENRNDTNRARQILQREFVNTYWFYFRFLNPKKTNVKLDSRKIETDIY